MEKDSKILVLGHKGMVGSAIIRALQRKKYNNIEVGIVDRTGWGTRDRLDLTNQQITNEFFEFVKPDYVFLAAAQVGGIYANSHYPAKFIYNNLQIQNNVIEASRIAKIKKMLFLGSSCIYPREAPQPLKEEYLLSGPLEKTNEYYAIAKISGIKMCEAYWKEYGCRFISCQPCNLYGPNDNYDLMNSHVIPAMIRRFAEAKKRGDKEVVIWGNGTPLREFLFVDDMAEACVFLMEKYEDMELVNLGSGEEVSIKDLALMIKQTTEFEGSVSFDLEKPNGTPRKIMDSSKIFEMGWRPSIKLKDGLQIAHRDFLKNYS